VTHPASSKVTSSVLAKSGREPPIVTGTSPTLAVAHPTYSFGEQSEVSVRSPAGIVSPKQKIEWSDGLLMVNPPMQGITMMAHNMTTTPTARHASRREVPFEITNVEFDMSFLL
jgi:hypothetical protein